MGGRSSDTGGGELTHPFEYDPVGNTLDDQVSYLSGWQRQQHGLRRFKRRRDGLHLLRGRIPIRDQHRDRSRLPV